MIDLSIIIVNYNVRYFLAQCLTSVLKEQSPNLTYEVIVVDNASTDDSFPFLEDKFNGQVIFIKNEKNLGFGQACNIGFKQSSGRYLLFLNPDTLVPDNTLKECFNLLESPEFFQTAALGVKLLDGRGKYLPESKRSLPTVWNSFCKLSGLARVFPGMKIFGGYNLTYLEEDVPAYIEALCGAFIMIRRKIFESLNGFDEDFFMYGEDLDLCRRIIKGGDKIYYYPDVHIVHFKGESHRQKDLKYYSRFYNAMNIYAGKHFSNVSLYMIRMAVFTAGAISFISSIVHRHLTKIIDFISLFLLVYVIKYFWAIIVYHDREYYDSRFFSYAFTFPTILIISLILSRYYKKISSFRHSFLGFVMGGLVSLAVYSLFPEEWRFSRSILILFLVMAPFILWLLRATLYPILNLDIRNKDKYVKAAFVGDSQSYHDFKIWSKFLDSPLELAGYIHHEDENSLGSLDSLAEIISAYELKEVIFDNGYQYFDRIYEVLAKYGNEVDFKVAGDKEGGVIGSRDPKVAGSLYLINLNYRIAEKDSIFLKRLIDLIFSFMILITFPIWLFIKKNIVKEAIAIFGNKKTWVGYAGDKNEMNLPPLKPSVLSIGQFDLPVEEKNNYSQESNFRYARNYSIFVDLELIFKYLFSKKR